MKRMLMVVGAGLLLGSYFWIQSQFVESLDSEGQREALSCMVSLGMRDCPKFLFDAFQTQIYTAATFFYIGLGCLIYAIFIRK